MHTDTTLGVTGSFTPTVATHVLGEKVIDEMRKHTHCRGWSRVATRWWRLVTSALGKMIPSEAEARSCVEQIRAEKG